MAINMNKIKNLPIHLQIIIAVVPSVILIALFFFLIYSPRRANRHHHRGFCAVSQAQDHETTSTGVSANCQKRGPALCRGRGPCPVSVAANAREATTPNWYNHAHAEAEFCTLHEPHRATNGLSGASRPQR